MGDPPSAVAGSRTMRHHLRLCILLLGIVAGSLPAQAQNHAPLPAGPEPGLLCRAAAAAVEREAGLPPRLLAAIARVESGRRDPTSGAFHPWPWTINAEGRGSFYPSKAAAIAALREMQAQGIRSMDVGCMQINLRHHPRAFASLEEAFDPLANVRYAARFLTELQATRNDWMRSAAHYHSQTPEFAEAYRARIVSALAAEQGGPEPAATALAMLRTPPAVQPAFQPSQAGGGFMLSNRMERAPLLPTPAGAGNGRGLDAYRTQPIPVAGRGPALAGRL
jgi:hypothetical protein